MRRVTRDAVVGLGLGRQACVACTATLALGALALAGPEGARVVSGSADIARSGKVTTIRASDNAIIDYAKFGIAPDETVRFIQPGATARVLNRVVGGEASHIDGSLTANGIVYIANPAGIFFGNSAIVDVGGIYAAAGEITNADFLNNVDRFTGVEGTVEHLGEMEAGVVHLIGRHVANRGSIVVPDDDSGMITMAAGDEVYIGSRDGHAFVKIDVDQTSSDAVGGVQNDGTVEARGGAAMMMAGDLFSLAMGPSGRVTADRVDIVGGAESTVVVDGVIDVTGAGDGGGAVRVLGERVGVTGTIDASGRTGGGEVLVGGNFQGRGDERNASRVFIGRDAVIDASAKETGDGGRVIVWSDEVTRFHGTIDAGSATGDGGFAEVSGKGALEYTGGVDLRSKGGGEHGTLLLDPTDIVVVDGPGNVADLADVDMFADPGGVSEIDAALIEGAMANVVLQATNDITFDAAITMANDNVGITADAGNDIIVNAPIITRGGDVTLTSDSQLPGSMSSGSGSVVINASIRTDGGGLTGGSIRLDAAGGVGSSGVVQLGADLTTADGDITLFNDDIELIASSTIVTDISGTSMSAGDITIAATPTSDVRGAFDLVLNAGTSGTVDFGRVGQTQPLQSLAASGGAISLRGDIAVDGDVTIGSPATPVTLQNNISIAVGGSGSTASFGPIGGDLSLSIVEVMGNAPDVVLNGIDVDALTIDTDGTLSLGGGVQVDGPLDLRDTVGAVTLLSDVALDVTGGTDAMLSLPFVTGDFDLTLLTDAGSAIGLGGADINAITLSGDTLSLTGVVTTDTAIDVSQITGAVSLDGDGGFVAGDGTPEDVFFDAANTIDGTGSLLIDGATVTLPVIGGAGGGGGGDPTSITIVADDLVLGGTVTAAGDITVRPHGGQLLLNNLGLGLSLTTADLLNFETFGTLTIGGAGTGTLNLAGLGAVDLFTSTYDLTLIGDQIVFNTNANDGLTLSDNRLLTLTSTGDIARLSLGMATDIRIGGDGVIVVDSGADFGTDRPLETAVARVAINAVGNALMSNEGALDVTTIGSIVGITAGGDIDISTASPLTITDPVMSTGGAITLTAAGGDDATLAVNADVTSDVGSVTLNADRDIVLATGRTVGTSGAASVTLNADADAMGADGMRGRVIMADGTTVSSMGGFITLVGDGDMDVASLSSMGPGPATITIISRSGDVIDANGDMAGDNIFHSGEGATPIVQILANNGAVGDGNQLEFTLNGVPLTITSLGSFDLDLDEDLTGAFIIADGTLTLASSGVLATSGDWSASEITATGADFEIGHMISSDAAIQIGHSMGGEMRIGANADSGEDPALRLDSDEIARLEGTDLKLGGETTSTLVVDGFALTSTVGISDGLVLTGDVVRFDGDASNFEHVTVLANDEAVILADVVTLDGDLLINGDANDAVDAVDRVRIGDGVSIESAGRLELRALTGGIQGDGAFDASAVDELAIVNDANFMGATTLRSDAEVSMNVATTAADTLVVESDGDVRVRRIVGEDDITIRADADGDGVGDADILGELVTRGDGAVMTLLGADVEFGQRLRAVDGRIRIGSTSATSIGVGTAAGDLTVSSDDLSRITAEDLDIVANADSTTTVSGITSVTAGGISRRILFDANADGAAIDFSGASSSFVAMTAEAANGIDIETPLRTTGDMILDGDANRTAETDDGIRLGSVSLVSGGRLDLITDSGGVELTGVSGSTVRLVSGTDQTHSVLTGDGVNVEFESAGGVNLTSAMLGTGTISALLDTDDNGSDLGVFGVIDAGSLTVTGTGGNEVIGLGQITTSTGTGINVTGGTVAFNATTTTSGGGGITVDASELLTINASAIINSDGAFRQTGGDVAIAGGLTTSDADVSFEGDVELISDATIATGGGDISFGGLVDGDEVLSLDAGGGEVRFDNAIGGIRPLLGLDVAADVARFEDVTVAGDIDLDIARDFTLDTDFVTTNGGTLFVGNAGTLTIPANTALDVDGGFVQDGTGVVILEGDFGRPDRGATFGSFVTLADDLEVMGSEVNFGSTVNSSFGVPRDFVVTAGTSRFDGDVGSSTPVRRFTASSGGETRLGGSITADERISLRSPVVLTGDSTLMSAGAGGVDLAAGVEGDGVSARALSVMTSSTRSAPLDLPTIQIGGDIGATEPLGSVSLNFASGSDGTVDVPEVPPIVFRPADDAGRFIELRNVDPSSSGFEVVTSGSFTVGQNQKITSFGALSIEAGGSVVLSDVVSLGDFSVTSPSIEVIARPGADLVTNEGLLVADTGGDFVVDGTLDFSTSPTVRSTGGATLFSVGTPDAGGDVNGTLSPLLFQFFGDISPDLAFLIDRALDLSSSGPTNTNIAESLAGAVIPESRSPDEFRREVPTRAEVDALAAIGIVPREATTDELVEHMIGRAIFNDYPLAFGGVDRPVVSVGRIRADRVREVVEVYDRMFRGAPGEEIGARVDLIATIIDDAVSAYQIEVGSGMDVGDFKLFLADFPEHRDAGAVISDLGDLLYAIESLGLSQREFEVVRSDLLAQFKPDGLNLDQFRILIRDWVWEPDGPEASF